MCYQFGQQVVSIGVLLCHLCKKGEQVVHQLLVPPSAVVVVHHLQPMVGHFLKKVCHASVSGGYANILFRKARATGAAAAAGAGGGSTAVQPRFSGSTAPPPSSTGSNRVKPLCEVSDPNEDVGLCHYPFLVAPRGTFYVTLYGNNMNDDILTFNIKYEEIGGSVNWQICIQ